MDFKEKIEQAYDYKDYRSMIDELVAQGKTTGPIQGEMMMQHTTMNVQRMNKWDKIAKFDASAIERVNNLKVRAHVVGAHRSLVRRRSSKHSFHGKAG